MYILSRFEDSVVPRSSAIHYLAKILIFASSTSIDRTSTKQYIREPCSFIKKTLLQIFANIFLIKKRKSSLPDPFWSSWSSRSSRENWTLTIFSIIDVLFRANIAPYLFLSKNFTHELSIVSAMESWMGGTGIWNCVSSISYEIILQHLTTGSWSNIGRSSTIVATMDPGWIELIFSEWKKRSSFNFQNVDSPKISSPRVDNTYG